MGRGGSVKLPFAKTVSNSCERRELSGAAVIPRGRDDASLPGHNSLGVPSRIIWPYTVGTGEQHDPVICAVAVIVTSSTLGQLQWEVLLGIAGLSPTGAIKKDNGNKSNVLVWSPVASADKRHARVQDGAISTSQPSSYENISPGKGNEADPPEERPRERTTRPVVPLRCPTAATVDGGSYHKRRRNRTGILKYHVLANNLDKTGRLETFERQYQRGCVSVVPAESFLFPGPPSSGAQIQELSLRAPPPRMLPLYFSSAVVTELHKAVDGSTQRGSKALEWCRRFKPPVRSGTVVCDISALFPVAFRAGQKIPLALATERRHSSYSPFAFRYSSTLPPSAFIALGLVHTNFSTGWGAVAERVDCSPPPPPRRTGFNPRQGHTLIFANGNRAGRCRWSACFLSDLPFAPPLKSGTAPFSSHVTLIGSQELVVKSRPNLSTQLHY
ncbi:hypothetical protein PR048_015134 [Dryococelus australis]|uniref:Uncharacterized protein n=1 Tax=Dryococelus australis TaxID=614101 RepID=A0ABQ9HG46_9NEOP|nr:hypothetical protein PR048_015134 [Dryococelus australis]